MNVITTSNVSCIKTVNMENKKNIDVPESKEDEIQAQITDKNEKNPEQVNAFKSGDDKQPRYYDKPFDEQMFDSFAEIREQRGEENSSPEESEK